MSHSIANIRCAVRPLAGAVLFCAVALVSACGGGGGGGGSAGGTVAPPIAPQPVNCGATTCADLANQQRTGEFNNQYGLGNINAHYAYAYGQHQTGSPFSGRGVTVAVVDSGVDRSHSEFSGRILPGYNAASPGNSVRDPDGHGTGVAGVIAAAKTGSIDGARVHGVAYESTILPVQTATDASGNFPYAGNGLGYAVTSGAFVVNNSWGPADKVTIRFINGLEIKTNWGPLFTEAAVDILRESDMEGIDVPTLLASLRSDDVVSILTQAFVTATDGVISNTEADKIVRLIIEQWEGDIRFAASWRAETPPADYPIVIFSAGNDGFNTETGLNEWEVVRNPANPFSVGQVLSVSATSNRGGFWGLFPLMAPNFRNHWLNVIAVDQNNRIADFSNGCGASKDWCIAAPGVGIIMPNTGGGRQINNGTSFAAPHVSGAAAVLKSAFPNLTAPQVVALLLTTARDLGDPGVDDVYGHGLVDLEKAARPRPGAVGFRLAYSDSDADEGYALDDFAFASLEDSRIVSSPVLSPKAQNVPVGFLDGFDRAYQTDLSRLVSPAAEEGAGFFLQPRARDRVLRNGFYVRGAAGEAPQSFGWRAQSGNVFADVFQVRRNVGAHSTARPGTGFAFALGAKQARGAALSGGNFALGVALAEGENGAALQQAAALFSHNGGGWRAEWESGMALEEGSALGATFGGAFAVRRAQTFYGRISGAYSLSPRVRVFAEGTAGRTRADAGAGAIADFSELRARGWSAGLAGDAWRLSFSRPLRTSSGAMRIRTAGGYDGSGAYAVRESVVDLSSRRAWRAAAEWTDGESLRLRSEVGESGRANFAAEVLF